MVEATSTTPKLKLWGARERANGDAADSLLGQPSAAKAAGGRSAVADGTLRKLQDVSDHAGATILRTRARVEQHEADCLTLSEQVEGLAAQARSQPLPFAAQRQLCDAARDLLDEQAASCAVTRRLLAKSRVQLDQAVAIARELMTLSRAS
jgi:hypothetical protein